MLSKLKQWARALKRDAYAVYLAARDPRVPWYAKALGIAVAAYAFSPIDLIPDFIPVLGYLDDDGFLTMRSRRAELIEVAGVPWYPRDVEEALCRIDGIRQAALVGVADKTVGLRPTAFVTLHRGAQHSAAALKAAIRGELAYDLEPLIVAVVAELPMTPTGKIAKSELAAQAARDSLLSA